MFNRFLRLNTSRINVRSISYQSNKIIDSKIIVCKKENEINDTILEELLIYNLS